MEHSNAFSFFKGFSFTFKKEANKIIVWFSLISGLEKVYLDGEIVSYQRTLSKNTTQTFKIGKDEYSINLQTTGLLFGPYICTLSKNGKVCKRQKLLFPKPGQIFLSQSLFYFLVGIPILVANSWWESKIYKFIFLLIIFLAALFYFLKTNKKVEPIIEEENISN